MIQSDVNDVLSLTEGMNVYREITDGTRFDLLPR
jgi:hypothetical protein